MTIEYFISQPVPPWIGSVDADPDSVLNVLKRDPDDTIRIFTLDGGKMRDFEGLYDEFQTTLHFPDYFGKNSNAMIDCFRDLAYASFSPVVVVIDNFDDVLREQPAEDVNPLQEFLDLLWYIAEDYSEPIYIGQTQERPSIPLHVLLLQHKRRQLFSEGHAIPLLEVD